MSGHTPGGITHIEIKPNYQGISQGFLKSFKARCQSLKRADLDTHQEAQSILAELNVAIQTIDSVENFNKFRAEFGDIIAEGNKSLHARQQTAEEAGIACTCDYPSTLGAHQSYCNAFQGFDEEPPCDERHGDALSPGADYEDDDDFSY